jgi:hypothetical protein
MTLLMRDRENVEKGIEQGGLYQLINMVYKKIQKGKALELIADELEEDISLIQKIYDAILLSGEDYDCKKIYEQI